VTGEVGEVEMDLLGVDAGGGQQKENEN